MKDDPDTWLGKPLQNKLASLQKRIATLAKSSLKILLIWWPQAIITGKRESNPQLSLLKWLMNAFPIKSFHFSSSFFVHRSLIEPWSAACPVGCVGYGSLPCWDNFGKFWFTASRFDLRGGWMWERGETEEVSCGVAAESSLDKRQQRINGNTWLPCSVFPRSIFF